MRNVYNPAEAAEAGFAYSSIGRPAAVPANAALKLVRGAGAE
jgi:hypothetical protein